MKKLILMTVITFMFSTVNAQKETKEASIGWNKKDGAVEYSISFHPEYKINLKAPFNFNLLDSSKKQIAKIEWSSFAKDEKGVYRYSSNKNNESFLKYWFVACKYQKDEIVSCKTFSQTVEIK